MGAVRRVGAVRLISEVVRPAVFIGEPPLPNTNPTFAMLHYAIIFLVIALVAGLLGLSGVAGTASWIAHVLFVIFLVLFLISFISGRRKPIV